VATQQLITFETGTGAKVEIVPLSAGDFAYPSRITITATSASAKNATTIAISASVSVSGQTLKIPAGTTLPFLDPVTGNTKIATLSADFSASLSTGAGPYTATGSLAVIANHEPIAINSTSSNFIKLGGRTTGAADIKVNDESLFTFDSTFYKQGQAITGEGSIKASGAYSSIDAGLRTIQDRTAGLDTLDGTGTVCAPANQFWIVVTTAAPTTAFTNGLVIRSIGYTTTLPIKVEAGKITTQDLDFKANGRIFLDPPLVA
jgi:hypothetical protein